jgi:hypothetical protein
MSAVCSRPGCPDVAVATFTFSPAALEAWVGDLDPDPRTLGQHLCADHAARLSVPSGWTLTDLRSDHPRLAAAAAPTSPMLARAFRSAQAS